MFNRRNILLYLIILVAAVLRIYKLDTMPPSLNWDEISHGYNALSVMQTGSDEWGEMLPIFNFRAYGDYPLPLTMYLTIPFVKVLGLTAFSVRLPQAVFGILTVIATYYLSIGLSKRKDIALLSSFLVAIDPWNVFTSRFVLQSNIAVLLFVASIAAFLHREKNKYLLPLSLVGLIATLFAYHSTRIFTPIFVVALLLIYRRRVITKFSILLVVSLFALLPFIYFNPSARARSNEVFLLNPNIVYSIEVARNDSTLPATLKRVIHNRPVYLISHFTQNYFEYFSPQFLFLKGGTQYQFSIPAHGLLYVVSLPFFYLGIFSLLKSAFRSRNKNNLLILAWLFLAPIPASLTTEHFAVVRATTLLPLPELLVAVGFFEALNLIKGKIKLQKKFIVIVFVIAQLVCLAIYAQKYFNSYRSDYSWAWQYGYEEAISFAKENYSSYDNIIITKKYGEPHEYVLFMWAWDASKYKTDQNLVRYNQSNWWWVDRFDKFYFVNDWEMPKSGTEFKTERELTLECRHKKCLLITSPGNAPLNWNKIRTVYFLDSAPVFELYDN